MAWTPPPSFTLNDAYYEIVRNITNNSWNRFVKSALRLNQYEIDQIEQEYPRSSRDRKYKMFFKWQEKAGGAASVETIYAVLNHFFSPSLCLRPDLQALNEEQVNINYCKSVQKVVVRRTDPSFYDGKSRQGSNYSHRDGKGCILILNNMFSHSEARQGSKLDLKNLKQLWTQLGSEVLVEEDLYAKDIKKLIIDFVDKCDGHYYCVVFVMSHGTSGQEGDFVLGNDHEPVNVQKDIIGMFSNFKAPHLQGIPKLFFFQCCRVPGLDGEVASFKTSHYKSDSGLTETSPYLSDGGLSKTSHYQTDRTPTKTSLHQSDSGSTKTSHYQSDGGPTITSHYQFDAGPGPSSRVPTTSDMFVSYATQSGNRAVRHIENGSWFVNAITNVFMNYARDEHVADMMTKVHNAVSSQTTTPGEQGGATAMPEYKSGLRKKLYLYPGYECRQGQSQQEELNINYCKAVGQVVVLPTKPGFYRHKLAQDANYPYKKKKGCVLILNNMFSHLEEEQKHRLNLNLDVENLKELWTQLGSKVQFEDDLNADDTKILMREFADKCEGYDYCVVFIMSHGNQGPEGDFVLGNDHKPVYVQKDILDKFDNENAKHLQHIPKLLFFRVDVSCCTGLPCASTNKAFPDSNLSVLMSPDMLVSYAILSENLAFRNTENGSWYVNAITNLFMKLAKDEHIADIMTQVNHAVLSHTDTFGKQEKAMTRLENKTTLRKKLYFYPGY